MLVAAPWAFGATADWAVWSLTAAGYLLGGLLVTKWLLRREHLKGRAGQALFFLPVSTQAGPVLAKRSLLILALLTGLILLYCLVSLLNARSTYFPAEFRFVNRPYLSWLPHSFDRARTFSGFLIYLGLALSFWATVDWLLGADSRNVASSPAPLGRPGVTSSGLQEKAPLQAILSPRLRRLLWVLCVNGALLGIESILQRLDGGNKLLWIKETTVYPWAEIQFGPYAYRGNAAQYFNLLWPVALGFCWTLRADERRQSKGRARLGSGPYLLLIPIAVLMVACPVISTSRGGALLSLLGLLLLFATFVRLRRHEHTLSLKGLILFAILLLAPGLYLGWEPLHMRFLELTQENADISAGRLQEYDVALKIIRDYPIFGIGPYAYETVSQFYVTAQQDWWSAQAHNDWLQTLAEWGWAGYPLIILALILSVIIPLSRPGPNALLVAALLISAFLLLVHAFFDFPFQIYSIFFTYLVLMAILISLGFNPPPAGSPLAGE